MDLFIVLGGIRDDEGRVVEFWIESIRTNEVRAYRLTDELNALHRGDGETFYTCEGPYSPNEEHFLDDDMA